MTWWQIPLLAALAVVYVLAVLEAARLRPGMSGVRIVAGLTVGAALVVWATLW
jgi:hypothetical protein